MIKPTIGNYSYWKGMKDNHLIYIDFAKPILNKNMLEGRNEYKWKLLNLKAVAIVLLSEHVSNFDDTYEIWTKLESMVQKEDVAQQSAAHKMVGEAPV